MIKNRKIKQIIYLILLLMFFFSQISYFNDNNNICYLMSKYNLDRKIPDHRGYHNFNQFQEPGGILRRLSLWRNIFVHGTTRHFPALASTSLVIFGLIFSEYITAYPTKGQTIDLDPVLKSARYSQNLANNNNSLGAYHSKFKCYKNDPDCGLDYSQ